MSWKGHTFGPERHGEWKWSKGWVLAEGSVCVGSVTLPHSFPPRRPVCSSVFSCPDGIRWHLAVPPFKNCVALPFSDAKPLTEIMQYWQTRSAFNVTWVVLCYFGFQKYVINIHTCYSYLL
ncbi:hypothetical protein CDAR_62791 [Caerostris darwini]|uniref:Uncharacterized protein n=1 Tax=Caerostris darwini TaxID=1538125 RepID=A0AAV4UF43_9ARAC|nr:hypothetical protein CDAR_62791 [Caerostris darwini]